MNTKLIFALAIAGIVLSGCGGSKTRRAPALVKEKEPVKAPPERGPLEKAGDVTWGVVTAPVRLVAPDKKPQTRKEPEVFEPAQVTIRGPRRAVVEVPASQPAP